MSCYKLNEQNEVDEGEFEKYDEEITISKHLIKDMKQFETQNKPNLNETKL